MIEHFLGISLVSQVSWVGLLDTRNHLGLRATIDGLGPEMPEKGGHAPFRFFGRFVNPISRGEQIMPTTLLRALPDIWTVRRLCCKYVDIYDWKV